MILSFKHKVMLFFCATAFCSAQDLNTPVSDVDVFRPEKRETKVQMVDSSQSNSVQLNVDIFADGFVGSYYILWDNVDLSEDIKKTIQSRNFAKDEFFMQNIDREQFEQERKTRIATRVMPAPERASLFLSCPPPSGHLCSCHARLRAGISFY